MSSNRTTADLSAIHAAARPRCRSQRARVLFTLLLVALLSVPVPGCSLGIMAGKMLFGDPKQKSMFRAVTGHNLATGDDRLLIVCTAPFGIQSQFPALQSDLLDRMSHNLKRQGVDVVPADEVASWYDDHGDWGDYTELAQHFKADFVMTVDLRKFSYTVAESDSLLQGVTEGKIRVHELRDDARIHQVFERDFNMTYPGTHPIPRDNGSDELFLQRFVERTGLYLAQYIYDHRMSETVY